MNELIPLDFTIDVTFVPYSVLEMYKEQVVSLGIKNILAQNF